MYALVAVLTLPFVAPPAAAAPESNPYPVSLYGSLAPQLARPGAGGGVSGALAWRGHPQIGLLLAAHETYAPSPGRTIGLINVSARVPLAYGFSVNAGFAHAHETLLAEALNAPVQTLAGTLPGITHRTGLGVGLMGEWRIQAWDRLGPWAALNLDWLADNGGPHVYATLDLGVAIDVGRAR